MSKHVHVDLDVKVGLALFHVRISTCDPFLYCSCLSRRARYPQNHFAYV